jgi:integrase
VAFTQATKDGRYRGLYRDGNGKSCRVPGTYARKAQALAAAAVAEAESRSLGWRDPKAGKSLFEDWVHEWWGKRRVEPATLAKDMNRLNRHVLPYWTGTRLADIQRQDALDWVSMLEQEPNGKTDDFGDQQTLSNSMIQKIVYLFSAALSAAVDEKIINYNPAARLKLKPAAAAVERYLTFEEYEAVWQQLPTVHDQLIADILVKTGLRFGELAGAHFTRLNPLMNSLLVVETWNADSGYVTAYPKSKRIRPVPFPADLVPVMQGLDRGVKCGERHQSGQCVSGLLVPSRRMGAPLNVNWWGDRVWKPAVERAQVGHCRVHDLRHTYASWLLQSRQHTLAEVGKLLGHLSPSTTARYSHLENPNYDRVMAALPSRGAPVQAQQQPRGITGVVS